MKDSSEKIVKISPFERAGKSAKNATKPVLNDYFG